MYYYSGSILPIEWTDQHGCGGNSKVSCEIIIQYACEDTLDPRVDDFWPWVQNKGEVGTTYRGTQHFRSTTHIAAPRDGVPIEFLTRHADAAVRLLAAAGSNGMKARELSNAFWPGVPEERQRARLRTMLWQARNSLGADAWRVQRQSDLVVFDTSGVDVSGLVTVAAIAKEFTARRSSSR